jgi:RND family efflux transporter MFP subunit
VETESIPTAEAAIKTTRGSEFSTFSTLLTAKSRVVVLSRVSGTVISVNAEEGIGRKWHKGELLARVDPRSYQLAYQRASAEADRARAVYEHNRKAREGFSGEFDVEIISELDMMVARTDYLKAQADSALQKMELDYTRIRAPIDGYITERRVQAGQWVGAQQELFTIVNIDTLWAVAVVPYSVLNALGPADIVDVLVNPGDEPFTVEGRLLLKNPVLLPPAGGTSGVKVTIQLINGKRRLLPGMPAELLLPLP